MANVAIRGDRDYVFTLKVEASAAHMSLKEYLRQLLDEARAARGVGRQVTTPLSKPVIRRRRLTHLIGLMFGIFLLISSSAW